MKLLLVSLCTLALSAPALACPLINGTFTRTEGNPKVIFRIDTSEKDGKFAYTFGGTMGPLQADGVTRAQQFGNTPGTASVSCEGSQMTLTSHVEGMKPQSLTFTLNAFGALVLEATGEYAPMLNGTYERQ